nr:unnamed protein product [Fasciola hepatica]
MFLNKTKFVGYKSKRFESVEPSKKEEVPPKKEEVPPKKEEDELRIFLTLYLQLCDVLAEISTTGGSSGLTNQFALLTFSMTILGLIQ